eukprot:m.69058 g.69058  ORF g.69058 m.69058 type:complete len:505 (-) comp12024_c0_seq1:64-1578(-)
MGIKNKKKDDKSDMFPLSDVLGVFFLATALKILLIPAYRSTDFEVHRNWLAITHSLPINQWYFEDTSEWTLDYPPFFAWFEYLLSWGATLFDKDMLKVENLLYASEATILYQRLTVIVTDLVLAYSTVRFCRKEAPNRLVTLFILIVCNAGLFIVDHVHFQYNGFMYGIMLLSISEMKEKRFISGSILFAALICLKHIYLYIAPAFFVYLLRVYCFQGSDTNTPPSFGSFQLINFVTLGVTVLSVFAACFGPFIAMNQIGQVLSRLFPFKRGLCHAYWAPNFWALYVVLDKILMKVLKVDGKSATMTGGLVTDDQSFIVLPNISPQITLIASVLSMLLPLKQCWSNPSFESFIRGIFMCGFGSFLFGWHVHEKAIMLVTIPMSLLAISCPKHARNFLILSTAGYFALFPLLFRPQETVLKIAILMSYIIGAVIALKKLFSTKDKLSFSWLELAYLFGFVMVQSFVSVIHPLLFGDKLPFLPLMCISTYSAIGTVYVWLRCLIQI